MKQLTLNIADSAAQKAARLAEQQRMSIDQFVQELIELAKPQEPASTTQAVRKLAASFQAVSSAFGGKPWGSRDELYDR